MSYRKFFSHIVVDGKSFHEGDWVYRKYWDGGPDSIWTISKMYRDEVGFFRVLIVYQSGPLAPPSAGLFHYTEETYPEDLVKLSPLEVLALCAGSCDG